MAAYMVSSSLSARQGYAPSVRVAARAGASPVAVRAPLLVVAKESRIGKHPVQVPKGVTYTLKDNHLSVKVSSQHLVHLPRNPRGAARGGATLGSVRGARVAEARRIGFFQGFRVQATAR